MRDRDQTIDIYCTKYIYNGIAHNIGRYNDSSEILIMK